MFLVMKSLHVMQILKESFIVLDGKGIMMIHNFFNTTKDPQFILFPSQLILIGLNPFICMILLLKIEMNLKLEICKVTFFTWIFGHKKYEIWRNKK
ncbi:hypothetical protein MTR67_049979 [Solanum verrucosum]|uniref:Uncharacterized protein n=1 Tax=Solanum verrucosum TaxID=315347 RepID=A0AAF0V3N3_SOLVR|nr:hypothetical protein MTR67_049979 [Solanum verrucosum]